MDESIPLPYLMSARIIDENAIVEDDRDLIQLGPYIITKRLGKGAFGITYLGVHRKTEEKVAIKKLETEAAGYEYEQLKSISSFCKGSNLSCPIGIYRANKRMPFRYIVSEYIDGYDLDRILSKSKAEQISGDAILEMIDQILSILNVLHNNNIYHRDIKPANVMYQPATKQWTLIDFGIACTNGSSSKCDNCQGSPGYMSPSYIHACKNWLPMTNEILVQNDIHALGVTALDMMKKSRPSEKIQTTIDKMIAFKT